MIFVTKADGGVTYVSAEWTAFTGQAAVDAVEYGWIVCVHRADHEIAVAFLRNARDQQSEFSLRLRLRRPDESYTWVMIGAVPSFGPPGSTFLGYLGSMTELSPGSFELLNAYGTLARFVPPSSHPATPPGSTLELVADYLLMAHGLIEQDHAKEMLPVLRKALFTAGILLTRNTTSAVPGESLH
ncbi:MAG: PAS domain-containing protein [Methylobacterium sp.]|uniref:PAS domain-containing protein n=1 Tax=Methylobacterium sp. TaxID=409 RepID=UPI002725D27B|nr:PAS domain-containing protein [Methylobacterium sp.]MDO9428845.1 PAS domain-containing protein [Methylobacterium sp.]